MPAPLAYFISWTTYGTWLHGDFRGWVESGTPGIQPYDSSRRAEDQQRMNASAITLDAKQREVVEATVRAHCQIRQWHLHAVNARSNHIHVVVTANVPPEDVMRQFKAWCSRRLTEHAGQPRNPSTKHGQRRWWTEHGSTKWINDEKYLANAVHYVLERQ